MNLFKDGEAQQEKFMTNLRKAQKSYQQEQPLVGESQPEAQFEVDNSYLDKMWKILQFSAEKFFEILTMTGNSGLGEIYSVKWQSLKSFFIMLETQFKQLLIYKQQSDNRWVEKLNELRKHYKLDKIFEDREKKFVARIHELEEVITLKDQQNSKQKQFVSSLMGESNTSRSRLRLMSDLYKGSIAHRNKLKESLILVLEKCMSLTSKGVMHPKDYPDDIARFVNHYTIPDLAQLNDWMKLYGKALEDPN